MGPRRRPYVQPQAYALLFSGEPVALAVSAPLIRETCAGLTRNQAVELARLCACRPHLCRVMLRLWREAVFPVLCSQSGATWAVSYQDEHLHNGDTYRFDGWARVARSRSGTDARSSRRGRSKTIWAWHADAAVRKLALLVGAPLAEMLA